ncbi:MAG: NUDIX domain-containing protein [Phycisphaerales bacterium]|nr:NUDIX domain-containing protein [Phycisphaerales bacterium]
MPRIVSDIVDVYPYRVADGIAQFLVLQRGHGSALGGTWQAVHGHIEPGETAFEAARREMFEETGLAPDAWHQLEFVNTFFMAARDEVHLCACFAARVGRDAEPALSDEHIAHVWEGVEDATARFHWPGQRRAIQEVCSVVLPGGAAAASLRLA